ncbi:MAG TPA: 1-acyl-sn-glycerol-3-phosphate acyltransferase [Polyangiales bacterium]|nr:1-acyl-sn-glycerol-3-phosphate acyltransferase [Polyangiales bacterium]
MTTLPLVPRFEPNPALRVLYSWFFDAIQVDDGWVRAVRDLARQGSVVYVLRNLNPVDFFALDHLTKRYDLPRVGFVNDLRLSLLNPMHGGFLQAVSRRRRMAPALHLRGALDQGSSAALFLKRPPSVLDVASGASGGRGLKEGDDLMRTLIDLQRETLRPVLLVPQVFLWTNRPDTHGSHYLDMFFGPREWPSSLRTIGQFLYNYKHVLLRAGEPLDLSKYLEAHAGAADANHVRRVIYVMLRRLERERRAVTGPAQAPPDRQRLQVLRSPKLQKTISHLAGDKPQNRYTVTRKALDILKEMQATPDTATIKALEVVLDRIFHRVYAGIDVDREGVDRIREKSKEHTIVLLPSHKSHVDYLVLSYVFNYENLSMPLIAAGDNLAFFPLGPVLRRAGGFFIRRQFGGDRLYSAAVEAYVRRMIREGHTLELFIEGGRSRTGKLLKPQVGMLSMLIDAASAVSNREVLFVPVSIGYERIVEAGAYGRELIGGEKEKEDAKGLLRGASVLRHRYGRINVQFGAHLSLDSICRELDMTRDAAISSPAKRRAVIARFGSRALDEINRVTAVTPGSLTALALLSDERRSLSHEELLQRCHQLLRVLDDMQARVTPRTATDGELREEAISEAVQMFVDAELLETHRPGDFPPDRERRSHRAGVGALYRVPERKRIELDVSKNIIVHFFVERALISVAALMPPGPEMALDMVRERARELGELFKHEFRLNGNGSFEQSFDDTLRSMQRAGELDVFPDGRLDVGGGRAGWSGLVWLRTYAAIMRNFLEGYRVAARGLGSLLRGPLAEKELLKRSLALGHRMYLSGEIERHEAVSKPILQNALTAFKDEGYVQLREGKYSLTASFESPDAVRAIEGRLAGYLEAAAE